MAARTSPMTQETIRFVCPWCAREITGYVPSRGDGSAYRLRLHSTPSGSELCDSRWRLVSIAPSTRDHGQRDQWGGIYAQLAR